MDDLHGSDPTSFWNILKQLKDSSNQSQVQIPANTWHQHFSNLMTRQNQGIETAPFDKYVTDFVNTDNNTNSFCELDYRISSEEVALALGRLKNGKAQGADSIPNEMLKCGNRYLTLPLVKLFNLVLLSGSFPKIWNESILVPVYKKGDPTNPENYRGICISSCVGKLFCQILQARLNKYVNSHGYYNKFQIGFKAKHCTTDHILVLKTLIDKYLKQKGKLYTCFVDFAQCFDTVWRDGLFYKLLKYNIGGLFYKVLRNMYTDSFCSVKVTGGKPLHLNVQTVSSRAVS